MKAEELKTVVDPVVALLRARLGPRAAVIVLVGKEADDIRHDVYYANESGPCLMLKGLIEHAIPEIKGRIKFTSAV